MTALNILIQVITDIYRNPRFLFFVVMPVHLAIAAIWIVPTWYPRRNLELSIGGTLNPALQVAGPDLLTHLALGLPVVALLLSTTAISWHRLVLSPDRFPTLCSALSKQPLLRYLVRVAPLSMLVVILAAAIHWPTKWVFEQAAYLAQNSTFYSIAWVYSEFGDTLFLQILWVLIGLGFPAIALGKKDRWLNSAAKGLRNSGTLLLSLIPVLALSTFVMWLFDWALVYQAIEVFGFAGFWIVITLKSAWLGLVSLALMGLITRFYELLVQPHSEKG